MRKRLNAQEIAHIETERWARRAQGYLAAQRGELEDACPYVGDNARAWLDGHLVASQGKDAFGYVVPRK